MNDCLDRGVHFRPPTYLQHFTENHGILNRLRFVDRLQMIFKKWMSHTGLSESSSLKYDRAIRGALSEWAVENHLTEGPLTTITSRTHFEAISKNIHNLPIFIDRNERGHQMYSSALLKYAEYLAEGFENDVESDVEEILSNQAIESTEKINLVKARIGQGAFRQKLIGLWSHCSVTKFKDIRLLIASHIKPWNASNNTERLDEFNGLLLVPNLDKTFDTGLITFDEDGKIRISSQLIAPGKLGITSNLRVALKPRNEAYMKFHRNEVFRTK